MVETNKVFRCLKRGDLDLVVKIRIRSAYLQSKQGEPIPDSMGTNRSSLYAVLIQRTKRNVSFLFELRSYSRL